MAQFLLSLYQQNHASGGFVKRFVAEWGTLLMPAVLPVGSSPGRVRRSTDQLESDPMSLVRLGISLFAVLALLAVAVAGATVWLVLTDPVTVADAVAQGDVSPLARALAQVLYDAVRSLLEYL